MSGWLSSLAERTRHAQTLSSSLSVGQTAYMVFDRRHALEQSQTLLSCEGKRDFTSLFAGTSLSPLMDASPWLLELRVGSAAWRYAQTLCHQRLGWMCQPATDQTLLSLANYLQALFVLEDSRGGKTLINLQQPAVWSALLASAPATCYAQCTAQLGQIATPTPQGQWLTWQSATSDEPTTPAWSLTADMEAALKESQQAWWLSQHTEAPLTRLPDQWIKRLGQCTRYGVTNGRHLTRLLPAIREASEEKWQHVEDILSAQHLPAKQRIVEVENTYDHT